MSVLQPRLFDNLPPTREETPVHQLNYPTFAGAENTMWHGRSFYPNSPRPQGGWNPERDEPVHVGTFEAAAHRGLGEYATRRTVRPPEGGRRTPTDEYRPRDEIMGVAGTEQGTQMLPFRVREGSMFNTPDPAEIVSDAYANLAEGRYVDGAYEEEYVRELEDAGDVERDEIEDFDEGQVFDFIEERGLWPEHLEVSGGLYYENRHEDPGSASAVVPTARDLQHWPTEVLKHSTNPAQRRTAEFLRGRGY